MPITVNEIKRSGDWALQKFQKTYVREFDVSSTSPTDSVDTILAAAGIPAIGANYLGAWCIKKSAEQLSRDDANFAYGWRVLANYDTVLPFDPTTYTQTPTLRPAIFSYDFETMTEAVSQDTEGTAIVNSATCPYSPPIERMKAQGIIKIKINKPGVPAIGAYINKINDATVIWDGFSYPAWTLLVSGATATQVYEESTRYIEVNWTVKFEPALWRKRVLDAGFYQISNAGSASTPSGWSAPSDWGLPGACTGTKLEAIVDRWGQVVSAAYPLDGNGRKLSECGNPVYNSFWLYQETSFAGMP